MSEFDIFFDEYENKHNCSPEKYECFEAGQQSKQDEIDELKMANHNLSVMTAEAESYSDYWKCELDKLQKRVNELELINFDSELHFDAAKEHIDSLQKRIEDALKELEYIHFYKTQNSDNAIKILKGEQTK